jgi:hypothetical protein
VNITEANATLKLLRWLGAPATSPDDDAEAALAAGTLAERASKALQVKVDRNAVMQHVLDVAEERYLGRPAARPGAGEPGGGA